MDIKYTLGIAAWSFYSRQQNRQISGKKYKFSHLKDTQFDTLEFRFSWNIHVHSLLFLVWVFMAFILFVMVLVVEVLHIL